jgi:hypothetical protein
MNAKGRPPEAVIIPYKCLSEVENKNTGAPPRAATNTWVYLSRSQGSHEATTQGHSGMPLGLAKNRNATLDCRQKFMEMPFRSAKEDRGIPSNAGAT